MISSNNSSEIKGKGQIDYFTNSCIRNFPMNGKNRIYLKYKDWDSEYNEYHSEQYFLLDPIKNLIVRIYIPRDKKLGYRKMEKSKIDILNSLPMYNWIIEGTETEFLKSYKDVENFYKDLLFK